MPIKKPMMPAKSPPTSMERISTTGSLAMFCDSRAETTAPVKAPMLMKPAWPSDSSPEMPTTRLSEMAMQA